MDNESDSKAGATVVSPPKNAKREGEDEDEKQVSAKKQKRDEVAEEQKDKEEISSDDASTDSEQDKTPDVKKGSLSTQEKKGQPATYAGSSKSSDDGSDEDEGEMDIDEGGSSEESDEEAQKKRMKVVLNATSNAHKPDLTTVEKDTYSDRSDCDNDNDNDGDDDDIEKPYMVKKPVEVSESSEDSGEEIGEKASKTYQESLKTPATLKEQNTASKTIYVRNLSYSVERADMENIFKECGEIVDVRLHTDHEGRFKGFGHVEFAIAEAAQKALELDNTELLKRPIKVGIAHERVEYTRNRSNMSNSLFHKGERAQPQTVFVKGFDRSLGEEKIKASLEEHFGSCGEITRISIPKFRDSGSLRGFAHLEFKDVDSMKKALQLHQTKLGGYPLLVQIAKALHHNQGIGCGRGGGGHQFVGRDGGGHGGRVGWGSSGDSWRH